MCCETNDASVKIVPFIIPTTFHWWFQHCHQSQKMDQFQKSVNGRWTIIQIIFTDDIFLNRYNIGWSNHIKWDEWMIQPVTLIVFPLFPVFDDAAKKWIISWKRL